VVLQLLNSVSYHLVNNSDQDVNLKVKYNEDKPKCHVSADSVSPDALDPDSSPSAALQSPRHFLLAQI
jgi:hypothetical protein